MKNFWQLISLGFKTTPLSC